MPEPEPADTEPAWSYTVSVRSFCAFTAKHGDLDRRFTPSATAAEGQLGEAAVAARRGPAYMTQIALSAVVDGLRLRGRADGFDRAAGRLEEIKTIRGLPETLPDNRRHLHWAQLMTYGALYCRAHGVAQLQLALVYVNADTQAETVLHALRSAAELEAMFVARCRQFLGWAQQESLHRAARDAGLNALNFPLPAFRTGQRALAEGVYRAAAQGRCLLAQAPTGIGKTLGVLYPLLRAMPGQKLDKIAYLTCKNTGRITALDALQQLRQALGQQTPGQALRVLSLTARDQACEHPDKACHGDSCPLARGFYDRLPAARADAATAGWLDQSAQRRIALQHGICPYYLGQEMLRWTDIVVGDVHHAFDLNGQLHSLTQALEWRVALAVDEAHNLVERTRQMYGASLRLADVRAVLRLAPAAVQPALRQFVRVANALATNAGAYQAQAGVPAGLQDALGGLNTVLAAHFQAQPFSSGPLLDVYFSALQLQWLSERMGSHAFFDIAAASAAAWETGIDAEPNHAMQQTIGVDAEAAVDAGPNLPDASFCIRNVAPGYFLQRRWTTFHTVTLFSATLGSQRYQIDLLGLPDNTVWLDVASPFDPAHLCVQIAHQVSTRYQHRARSLDAIVDLMAGQLAAHPGNYLAFFSSFAYLDQAAARLRTRWPELPQWQQARAMDDVSRRAFLCRFDPGGQGIGLAVLGGAFAEGVDLPGSRLIGAFIATLGLPPVSPLQQQMRDRLDASFGAGHGYADLVPGMQKVMQAAGRVIRTPEDRGWVWLLDDRYGHAQVRTLLPSAWRLDAQRVASV